MLLNVVIIGIARLKFDFPWMSGPAVVSVCTIKSWLLLFVPYVAVQSIPEGVKEKTILWAVAALPAVALAAVAFYWTQPEITNCPVDTPRWLRQAGEAGLASAIGLVPLYLLV